MTQSGIWVDTDNPLIPFILLKTVMGVKYSMDAAYFLLTPMSLGLFVNFNS